MSKQKKRTKLSSKAIARELPNIATLVGKPAPVDVWLAAVQIFQGAARFTTPVENPEQFGVTVDGQRYAFTDIPINRGMLAVRELVNNDPHLFVPIASRCMSLGPAIQQARAEPRFAPFFKLEEESDAHWMVSENLLGAFAQASFAGGRFDMDSVYEHAEQLRREDELKEETQSK